MTLAGRFVVIAALAGALTLAACAHGAAGPSTQAGVVDVLALSVESPAPGTLLRTTEVDVVGRVSTYDGRAWVYVQSTAAEIHGPRFVAKGVPLRPGQVSLPIVLSDGHGRKRRIELPLVVERPERPRSATLCRAALGCLRYEERGVPRRNAAGRITNGVLVLAPFGFDERLDELWPDLVGPGRAFDPGERYLVGVAPASSPGRGAPEPEAMLGLLDELLDERHLDRRVVLVGVSTYGTELVLRSLARGQTTGPVLICGGHDRPYDEPTLQRLHALLSHAEEVTWTAAARVIVPASYGAGFLADVGHAAILGQSTASIQRSLEDTLIEQLTAHFGSRLPVAELGHRLEAAFALAAQPLTYPPQAGRRVVLVANRDDQLVSVTRVRALGVRLAAAGAKVFVHELADPLGHSVFFLRVPLELETAVQVLFTGAEASPGAKAPR